MFAPILAQFLALSLALACLPAHAGRLVDLEIFSRSSGETLSPYRHSGQTYVAGNPGERYGVRLANRTGQRVLVCCRWME